MTQSSYPFDGLPTTEAEYSRLFSQLQETGAVGDGDLVVSADASGMNVKVSPGMAIVRGHAYISTETETLPIEASGSQVRIDTVVLRLDPTEDTILLDVVTGEPGAGAPPLEQTDTSIYEMPLANVTVGANAVTIGAAAVTPRRPRTSERLREWTTDTRPDNPRVITVGLNRTRSRWEVWDGTKWSDLISWKTLPDRPTTSTLDGRTIYDGDGPPSASLGSDLDIYLEW